MADKNDAEKPPTRYIDPQSVESEEKVGIPTIWLTYSFAPEWFEDALKEAKTGQGHNARRRETVFAVSFVESYLFEWVRDEVLNRDFQKLTQYFPAGERRGIWDKWKNVPKDLHGNGEITAAPDYSKVPGQTYWNNFKELVDIRDGIIHASSSRPETDPQPAWMPGPYPSKGFLDHYPAGEATKVVVALVEHLHQSIGTTAPTWLVEP